MSQKICVTGGSGFLGQEICRIASEKGYHVISISRTGRPILRDSWVNAIRWIKSDIFDVVHWSAYLEGCYAVIHCIDVLHEQISQGITYEHIIGGAARIVAQAADKAGVKTFVFLSRYAPPRSPSLPIRYMIAKRYAEDMLLDYHFRHIILRLTYVYGSQRPLSMIKGLWLHFLSTFPITRVTYEKYQPLHVWEAALATLQAIESEHISGIIAGEKIQRLIHL